VRAVPKPQPASEIAGGLLTVAVAVVLLGVGGAIDPAAAVLLIGILCGTGVWLIRRRRRAEARSPKAPQAPPMLVSQSFLEAIPDPGGRATGGAEAIPFA
jgi:hypothetical protein